MIQEKNPVTVYYTHCIKCGQPLIKHKMDIKKICLSGYEPRKELCYGCNATNSVVSRLKTGGNIELEELNHLPNFLIFDPTNKDPEEASYGIKFMSITKKYCSEYEANMIDEISVRL